jgi:hypothetical protein
MSDEPECGRCHATVNVGDGLEWEEGDICNRCLQAALAEAQNEIERLANKYLAQAEHLRGANETVGHLQQQVAQQAETIKKLEKKGPL